MGSTFQLQGLSAQLLPSSQLLAPGQQVQQSQPMPDSSAFSQPQQEQAPHPYCEPHNMHATLPMPGPQETPVQLQGLQAVSPHSHQFDVLLSAEMAISPNRMRTASPDSGDSQNEKNGSAKANIVREVEAAMASQLEHYGDDGLKQWHSHLQNQLSEASHAHHQARDWLKQVDTTRALARDEYRLTQVADKQKAWKGNVAKLKDAQDSVKTTRENFYRAAAAVEAVTRELKRRAGAGEQARSKPPAEKANAKRKRTLAPEEPCPYCGHAYTVRDGLSSKTDTTGDRLHLRKCQCREKTPPCRNCPKCKGNEDIMSHNDPTMQYQLCQLRFKCEICSCRCPGAGKWVEHDSESRQAYAARTGQRHGQLSALGWHGTVGMTLPSMPANGLGAAGSPVGPDGKPLLPGGVSGAGSPGGKRSKSGRREHLKRLPADIRAQVQVLQSQAGSSMPGEWQSVPLSISHATGSLSMPQKPMMGVDKPPPELPIEVIKLVQDVFLEAAGPSAEHSVQDYLRSQRVTSLADLQYLQLNWLCSALQPMGIPPLLLNKFLAQAGQRIADNAPANPPMPL